MNTNQFQNKKMQELNEEFNNLIIEEYKSQIESLKSQILDLELEIKELKARNIELNNRNIALLECEYKNVVLNTEKKELKQAINDLEQDVISTLKKGKEETRDVAFKLENEVNNYKRINDTIKGKIEAAEHIVKLNMIQHNYILKLEKELEDTKKRNLMNIDKLNVEHELHFKNLKQKMIDLIKKSNKEIQKENITNIEIHSKFSAINKVEMLEELEKQNFQIIELIKENEAKDKQILNLTQEKQTFLSVDRILKKKNLKFSKLIQNFLEQHGKKEDNDKKINNENDNKQLFKTTTENKNIPKWLKLEKEYENLSNNYNLLKEKFDYITDREKEFQKKYCSIIILYDTALKELMKDEKIIKKKISINFNNFLEGNIDTYTKEEKINIIFLLMKHLLPLIKVQSNEIVKLRNLFNNIDIKFKINSGPSVYSRNQNSNIIRSLYDIRQFTSNLNYSLKKEENLKAKNKSIFNTYNNTYNNSNHNNLINLMNSKEDSKSLKHSFFGFNINTSAIKKKGESKLSNLTKTTSTNIPNIKSTFSAFNFYKNGNKPKNHSIKMYKKGIIKDEIINSNFPLQRLMFVRDSVSHQKSKNNCVTEDNNSTQ